MKSIYLTFLATSIFSLPSYSQFDDLGDNDFQVGMSIGHRVHNVVYLEGGQTNIDNAEKRITNGNYFSVNLMNTDYLNSYGIFHAGYSYYFEFGIIQCNIVDVNNYFLYDNDKSIGVMGSIGSTFDFNFGDTYEKAYFASLGAQFTLVTEELVGNFYIGPKMRIGKRFELGDYNLAVSADFLLALNRKELFDYYKHYKFIENKKYQFGLTLMLDLD